jgi:hypothetical protein
MRQLIALLLMALLAAQATLSSNAAETAVEAVADVDAEALAVEQDTVAVVGGDTEAEEEAEEAESTDENAEESEEAEEVDEAEEAEEADEADEADEAEEAETEEDEDESSEADEATDADEGDADADADAEEEDEETIIVGDDTVVPRFAHVLRGVPSPISGVQYTGAPKPLDTAKLYTGAVFNPETILSQLVQHDSNPKTMSDEDRCGAMAVIGAAVNKGAAGLSALINKVANTIPAAKIWTKTRYFADRPVPARIVDADATAMKAIATRMNAKTITYGDLGMIGDIMIRMWGAGYRDSNENFHLVMPAGRSYKVLSGTLGIPPPRLGVAISAMFPAGTTNSWIVSIAAAPGSTSPDHWLVVGRMGAATVTSANKGKIFMYDPDTLASPQSQLIWEGSTQWSAYMKRIQAGCNGCGFIPINAAGAAQDLAILHAPTEN